MKKILFLIIITLFVLLACTPAAEIDDAKESLEEPINVAVSIVPQKTFVEKIAHDKVELTVLIPPGYSPGNYEPTPQEIQQFSKSNIYFSIGVPTEATNIYPLLLDYPDIKVINTHELISKTYPEREMAPGSRDAHIWLSPKRVISMVEIIAEELSLLDPDNESFYQENAEAFIEELNELDSTMKDALEDVEGGSFIVYHPAFGYLAEDYGLKMYALEEGGKEATPQRMQEMVDIALENNVKAVFYQSEISSKQADSFAEEIGGKTVQLEPLSADYINNLLKMADLLAEVLK